jgi:hypothetical protein
VREYFGQFVSKQAQSVIDDILAKRLQQGVGALPQREQQLSRSSSAVAAAA